MLIIIYWKSCVAMGKHGHRSQMMSLSTNGRIGQYELDPRQRYQHLKGFPSSLPLGQVANVDILETHIPQPAGMKLEGDVAVEGLRCGIREVHHQHTV